MIADVPCHFLLKLGYFSALDFAALFSCDLLSFQLLDILIKVRETLDECLQTFVVIVSSCRDYGALRAARLGS